MESDILLKMSILTPFPLLYDLLGTDAPDLKERVGIMPEVCFSDRGKIVETPDARPKALTSFIYLRIVSSTENIINTYIIKIR